MDTLNSTLYGVSIALLYCGLLSANDMKNLKVSDVVLSREKKRENDPCNVQSSRTQRNEDFLYNVPNDFFDLFEC